MKLKRPPRLLTASHTAVTIETFMMKVTLFSPPAHQQAALCHAATIVKTVVLPSNSKSAECDQDQWCRRAAPLITFYLVFQRWWKQDNGDKWIILPHSASQWCSRFVLCYKSSAVRDRQSGVFLTASMCLNLTVKCWAVETDSLRYLGLQVTLF